MLTQRFLLNFQRYAPVFPLFTELSYAGDSDSLTFA